MAKIPNLGKYRKRLAEKSTIEKYILPLFSGASIEKSEESSAKNQRMAVSVTPTMLKIKFGDDSPFRHYIQRSQPFTKNDIALLNCAIKEMTSNAPNPGYEEVVYGACLERAICEYISSIVFESEKVDRQAAMTQTLINVISAMNAWSLRTYEGRRLTFGIIVDGSKGVLDKNIEPSYFIDKDYFAPLSDAISTSIKLDINGLFISHETLTKSPSVDLHTPYRFIDFTAACEKDKIGIALLQSGEVLLFSNKQLLFAKREGKWQLYDHGVSITRFANGARTVPINIRTAIYLTALDVSFARTGGCIGYINKTMTKDAVAIIKEEEVLIAVSDEQDIPRAKDVETAIYKRLSKKASLIYSLIGNTMFDRIDRKLRQELSGIDGALVINSDGNVIACGTILTKVSSSTEGGGRLAAALELSNHGMSVKISADGGITGFHKENKTFTS